MKTRSKPTRKHKRKGAHARPKHPKGHKLAKHPSKHHKHLKGKHKHKRKHAKHKPTVLTHRVNPGVAPVSMPTAPAPTNVPPSDHPAPVLKEPTTLAHMNRLLWRAGFGGKPGQAQALVGRDPQTVVHEITRPSEPATLIGPAPKDEQGHPLAPADAWGHDHCWWLDRMVRSNQQLVERMTLIWHDWFANSNEKVNSQQMMLDQNELLRSKALGSFQDLFMAITTSPAMLVFLDSIYNNKDNPNENYAREMMELFSLGADRGAYTEDDVREMARALTGWTAEYSEELGLYNFHFDPSEHDGGNKTVFGRTGHWNWEDAVRLCVSHPLHASFFVQKLWGYFIPVAPDAATLSSLQGVYLSSGFNIRMVVEAILQHPTFYEGPELVSPPVVYNAGLLRGVGRYIDTTSWAWLCASAGQQLFYPPNVSGWDDSRWLDTSTAKARWELANEVTENSYVNPWPQQGEKEYSATEKPQEALIAAMNYWGNPLISNESMKLIETFANTALNRVIADWEQSSYRAIRQNALRMLIATAPDMQVS